MTKKDVGKLIVWELFNPIFLSMKRNKKYSFSASRYVGINLGCGMDNPANWLGVDGGATIFAVKKLPVFILRSFYKYFEMSELYPFESYYSKITKISVIHHNLLNGVPFKDSSIPYIYTSHFLEHLFQPDAEKLLLECRRALRPGGILRICIPSLGEEANRMRDALIEYENGNYESIQKYVTSSDVGYISAFSHHRRMYDADSISHLLSQTGFEDIKELSFRKGHLPDLELLETRSASIFFEAKKI